MNDTLLASPSTYASKSASTTPMAVVTVGGATFTLVRCAGGFAIELAANGSPAQKVAEYTEHGCAIRCLGTLTQAELTRAYHSSGR
jgi:hypothetical protein